MGVFKDEKDFKRVIFNVESSIAERLEQAKERSRVLGRKLDVDTAVDKALEKFLKKAEKKLDELEEDQGKKKARGEWQPESAEDDSQERATPGKDTSSDAADTSTS
jgi:hypothetical protein